MGEERRINHLLVSVDGNRRYAKKYGLDFDTAYRKAVDKVYELIRWTSVDAGIPVVSLHLLSQYNLQRPKSEVESILGAACYAMDRMAELNGHVQYTVCGNLSLLREEVADKIRAVEDFRNPDNPLVNLLVCYSGSDDRLRAIKSCIGSGQEPTEENLIVHTSLGKYPIDVFIRTGGVVRLSDGPMVGIAQTRMYPVDKLFAELEKEDILRVLDDFKLGRKL
ncbi:undecaprenyl diphosphate synthase family protein [Candidatus Woesearchaeota archaeon]|nr:undecaprenyl diphosphate synthase family protein [Candidatus Woesearchaeota archaeon]